MTKHLRHGPCDFSNYRCREKPNRFWGPKSRHCAIVCVQQNQPCNALRMDKGPVNRRRTRGVMRDEDYMLQPQLSNDGIQFPDLVGSGIRIAGGFVRSTPPRRS